VNRLGKFFGSQSGQPRRILAAASTHLGDDHQPIRVRMQCLLDDLVGDVWAVKIAGIDVIDAARDHLAQNSKRSWHIFGWPPNVRPGELHGAIAHPLESHRSARQREAAAAIHIICHVLSFRPPSSWMRLVHLIR
jgi:hypothetical protein